MSLIIAHSPKGGVGTTFVAANLALALGRRGVEVAAVDLSGQDLLGVYFGLRPRSAHRTMPRTDGVIVATGVRIASAGSGGSNPLDVLDGARAGNGVTIVDVAAADDELLTTLLPTASLRLCVINPDPAFLPALPGLLSSAKQGADTCFVLNCADDRLRLARDIGGFLHATLGDLLVGTIRRDEAVNEALAMLTPLPQHMPASAAFADITRLAEVVARTLSSSSEMRGVA